MDAKAQAMAVIDVHVRMIDCELALADKYLDAVMWLQSTTTYTDAASNLAKLAQSHLESADTLHNAAVKTIDSYRAAEGSPSDTMLQMWAARHMDYIDKTAELKHRIELVRK